jgi:hypothetical protein
MSDDQDDEFAVAAGTQLQCAASLRFLTPLERHITSNSDQTKYESTSFDA